MGKEIRRVPANWEHPKDEQGHYIPLLDRTYEEAFTEWKEEKGKWDRRESKFARAEDYEKYTFEEWHGEPPDPESYRPAFMEKPTYYQIYEDVSEGTPISPIFETLGEIKDWLLGQGYSEKAADALIHAGYGRGAIGALDYYEEIKDAKKGR